MKSLIKDILKAFKKRCPVCGEGHLFSNWYSFEPVENCGHCDAYLKDQDVGDAAIVFLIFALGFIVAPVMIVWELIARPNILLQVSILAAVCLALTFWLTPVIKTYVMTLQYRHRGSLWNDEDEYKGKK